MRNLGIACLVTTLLTAAAAHAEGTSDTKSNVPQEESVAIGAGILFPSPILTWARVNAKVRLAGMNLQIEPFLILGGHPGKTTTKNTPAAGTEQTTEVETGGADIGLGASVYYPLMSATNIELQILGSLLYSRTSDNRKSSDTATPSVHPETSSSSSVATLGYGVAIEWWFYEHLSVQAMALNSLLNFHASGSDSEDPTGKSSTDATTWRYGLVWSPTVAATLNLWF